MSPLNDPYWEKINVPAPRPSAPKPSYRRPGITGRQAVAVFVIMAVIIWVTIELTQIP